MSATKDAGKVVPVGDALTAIVLAAGLSRRMEGPNKLLLDWFGLPVIRHLCGVYLGAIKGEVIVVTGYMAPDVRAALAGLPVRFVHNAHYADGQQGSVVTGLQAVGEGRGALVGLGDQTLLTADDLQTLIAAHAAADPEKVTVPVREGARGNPVLIPAGLVAKVLDDGADAQSGRFIDLRADHVQSVEMAAVGFFADIDTPALYEKLLEIAAKGRIPRAEP